MPTPRVETSSLGAFVVFTLLCQTHIQRNLGYFTLEHEIIPHDALPFAEKLLPLPRFIRRIYWFSMEQSAVVNYIKDVARETLPACSSLLLYGSRARGDARQNSDWDLLILLDKPQIETSDFDDISFPFTLLGWKIGENISPQLYTRKEWDSIAFLPFHQNVEHDKIILV